MLVFFSVIRVSVDIKIKSKERIGFVVVVFFLFLGVRRFTFRNGRVLEMQNSTPAYVKGYTYVLTRTDDFLRTKIYGMHRYIQIFLPIVLRCEARVRAPL